MYPIAPLTPNNITAVPRLALGSLDFDDIQGDVFVGLQKKWQIFQFFTIADVPKFKKLLRSEIAKRVTSTRLVIAREFQLRDAKTAPAEKSAGDPQFLPLVGMNVAFTNSGTQKLVPGAPFSDEAFTDGALGPAAMLGDPLNGTAPAWKPVYLDGGIDGVFSITAGNEVDVGDALTTLKAVLGAAVAFLDAEKGRVREDDQAGHEHFGFLDGVSQPAIKGFGIPYPGQQAVDAGRFMFGYDTSPPVGAPWMLNGSLMVLRRLKQLVPEFEAVLNEEGARHGMDGELLRARMMGRWKSGAQISDTPFQDDAEIGADPTKNNDFDFSDDIFQRACPYGAHIRKVNPRVDITGEQSDVDPHRIIRAGIPFGPEVSDAEEAAGTSSDDPKLERGLLFVCYQTSIVNQFEFVQRSWANNVNFGSPEVTMKFRPNPEDPTVVEVGFDPIIGQANGAPRFTDEAVPNFPRGNDRSRFEQKTDVVVPQGGAYFFVPSISALVSELAD